METVNVVLNMACLVVCPNCDDIFDLFEMSSLVEDGYVFSELLPRYGAWDKKHWGEIIQ